MAASGTGRALTRAAGLAVLLAAKFGGRGHALAERTALLASDVLLALALAKPAATKRERFSSQGLPADAAGIGGPREAVRVGTAVAEVHGLAPLVAG